MNGMKQGHMAERLGGGGGVGKAPQEMLSVLSPECRGYQQPQDPGGVCPGSECKGPEAGVSLSV